MSRRHETYKLHRPRRTSSRPPHLIPRIVPSSSARRRYPLLRGAKRVSHVRGRDWEVVWRRIWISVRERMCKQGFMVMVGIWMWEVSLLVGLSLGFGVDQVKYSASIPNRNPSVNRRTIADVHGMIKQRLHRKHCTLHGPYAPTARGERGASGRGAGYEQCPPKSSRTSSGNFPWRHTTFRNDLGHLQRQKNEIADDLTRRMALTNRGENEVIGHEGEMEIIWDAEASSSIRTTTFTCLPRHLARNTRWRDEWVTSMDIDNGQRIRNAEVVQDRSHFLALRRFESISP
ncbi:hypothetical protein M413DRAFT_408378 [Hebeloma cylindrosporum]|uniref:Uncharacterized protein n=1 Tax=Hebeloma cylindrosporum TaxID=76867 RepID=A0A0C3C0W6_HEBCY|nr:hypothetical protein M413DRAFT_408378 [Hebeloma cylindrosporum h7]